MILQDIHESVLVSIFCVLTVVGAKTKAFWGCGMVSETSTTAVEETMYHIIRSDIQEERNISILCQLCLSLFVGLLALSFIYTGCPRRKGQNFGRVFLMLKYTDITQNTYIQS